MKVYLYDKETLLYSGCRDARLDVLETKKQGHEVYAKPQNGTFTEIPKLKEGMTALYLPQADGWKVVESVVGKYLLNVKNGQIKKITENLVPRSYEIILDEEKYQEIKKDPDKYTIRKGKLVDLSGTQDYKNKQNIKKYEELILEAKKEYDDFLETPVEYKGMKFLPRYLDDFDKLQFRTFPQEIWDCSGLKSKVMNKDAFIDLKRFIEELVTQAYKVKKEKIKKYKEAIKNLGGK